ncbi:MAG TPA: nucleotidyltransferase domain-containing protein [Candidatus Marinimicrobia bacterium]|nr:nucleotidyltransferase domain-containing protein [Candidatus Neomarinimicrobiota bacterium]
MITIQDVIRNYKPEKVILFGSRANGNGNKDSDWDYLIIKETKTRRINRREEALTDFLDVPADLLILTPSEIEFLLESKSEFIQSIMENGKLIYEKK